MLVPTLAGLVIGLLVGHVFPLSRGSGVNQTQAALYIYDGCIAFPTVVGKSFVAENRLKAAPRPWSNGGCGGTPPSWPC